MASWQSRILEKLFWLIKVKDSLDKTSQQLASDFSQGRPLQKRRDLLDTPEPPAKLKKSFKFEQRLTHNQPVFTLSPKNGAHKHHILYLHGGAYIKTFLRPHWGFLAKLIEQLNCTITAPDYPLAPAATYQDNFQLLITLYQEIITQVDPINLTVMGDSAGGAMSLALAQKLHEHQLPQPGNIILLSPWLDATMTNPEIAALDRWDPLLSVNGLKQAGRMYAGSADPTHYLVSPINGSLNNLGDISLFIGTRDVLWADCRRFKTLASEAGVVIDYYEYTDMLHDWMLLPIREADQVVQQVIDKIVGKN